MSWFTQRPNNLGSLFFSTLILAGCSSGDGAPDPEPLAEAPPIAINITSPSSGTVLDGSTLTVIGTSSNASNVTLSLDGGPQIQANGVDNWNVVLEEGLLSAGSHTLVARATNGGNVVTDSISVSVSSNTATGATTTISYNSSVDGETMNALIYVPTDLDPSEGPVPLVVHLHGGGGLGSLRPSLIDEFESRRWIGIAPDGRRWGLFGEGCGWRTSAAYVDSPDPNVGPGEQDIFDAISWAQANYNIDPDRIYLLGFSMGGRGTYAIGLKNPDFFAAIAPMGPATDMFEVYDRRPEPAECKEGMVGGKPGDSPFVDTMYKITSGRFLLENAYNLPTYHAHGLEDGIALNQDSANGFLHGWHVLTDISWNDCHGSTSLCFGHTPTLTELKERHPEAYDWAYMFTSVGHVTDDKWLLGTTAAGSDQGTADPHNAGSLVGILDFFARRTRVNSPETIVYKVYTDTHEDAFWLTVESATPWQDQPAAVRAARFPGTSSINLELARVERIAIDLDRAELPSVGTIDLTLDRLNEMTFDPALQMAPTEALQPMLQLNGDFSTVSAVAVVVDSVALPSDQIDLQMSSLAIGPIDIETQTSVTVSLAE